MADSYDVFLVLHPFRSKLRQNLVFVTPLEPLAPELLLGVEAFYTPDIDVALIALRFEPEAAVDTGAAHIHDLVSRCGLPMVVPARLSAADRRRFFLEHVSRCSVYLQQYASADEPTPLIVRALTALDCHLEVTPAPRRSATVDIAGSLPLFDVDRPARSRSRRRLDSVG